MFRRSVILLMLMMVVANLAFTAVPAHRLVEAASNADLEPPSISILQPQQNTSIAPGEPLVVRAQLVISDNNKSKTLIVNLVKDTQQYEMGYISEKENIKDIGITLTKNWPEPEIDTSRETSDWKINSWEGGYIKYFVDYVNGSACVVDLILVVEDPNYYGISTGNYWLVFIAEDDAHNVGWNSILLNINANTKIREFVLPAGSVEFGHPFFWTYKDFKSYFLLKGYDAWQIVTDYVRSFKACRVGLSFLILSENISVSSGFFRKTFSSLGFVRGGFLITFLRGDNDRLKYLRDLDYLGAGSTVFRVLWWPPTINAWILTMLVAIVVTLVPRQEREKSIKLRVEKTLTEIEPAPVLRQEREERGRWHAFFGC